MARRVLAALALGLGIIGLAAPAAADGEQIAQFHLTGVIDQVNAAFIEESLRVAADEGSAAAIIVVDSPGGELTSMDRIIKAILGSEVPVIAWVAPEGARAASAATFVVLAADVAAMAPNTNIGAASVVGSGGEDLPETLARKVTNDAVARIRSLADDHDRNADWAESAVREAGQHRRSGGRRHGPAGRRLHRRRSDLPARGCRRRRARRRDPLHVQRRAAAAAERPAGPRHRDELRPAVPPPAERPEHRVHPVHHRLLRHRRRALPSRTSSPGSSAPSPSCSPSSARMRCRSTSAGCC